MQNELEKSFLSATKNNSILIICGPTASGKTKASIELATQYKNTVIVNLDAYQVYKDIPICSASPTQYERSLVEHQLFNYIDYDQAYSVGLYLEDLDQTLHSIYSNQKIPILVGGSSLYIYSVINGLRKNISVPLDVRTLAKIKLSTITDPHEYVKSILPLSFQADFDMRIHKNDLHRITRVFEFFIYTSGYLFDGSLINQRLNWKFEIFKIIAERQIAYDRADARVLQMIYNDDAIKEIKRLVPVWENCKSIKTTLLAKEIYSYLNDEISLEQAISLGQCNTRKFIKKQLTWLRNKI